MRSLQLLGMKHSGKSTLGALAARRLGWSFADLDTLLEAEHGGKSAREIYRDLGKETFQTYEVQAAQRVLPRLQAGRFVLAWGGGTATNPAAEILQATGTLVLLEEAPDVLFERIRRNGLPPFLSPQDPWKDFQALYIQRMARMSELCSLRIPLQGASPEVALELLFSALQGDPHAR